MLEIGVLLGFLLIVGGLVAVCVKLAVGLALIPLKIGILLLKFFLITLIGIPLIILGVCVAIPIALAAIPLLIIFVLVAAPFVIAAKCLF